MTIQTPHWLKPDWLAEANSWIDLQLERRGIRVSGPIEQPHLRPCSTVLRVPTSAGDLYFKAAAPVLAHEPALTQALFRSRPDCMPPVLALDVERGWLLSPDLGVMLRSLIQSPQDLWHWHNVLSLYAELQLEMTSRLD